MLYRDEVRVCLIYQKTFSRSASLCRFQEIPSVAGWENPTIVRKKLSIGSFLLLVKSILNGGMLPPHTFVKFLAKDGEYKTA